jgi:hypothetical protein
MDTRHDELRDELVALLGAGRELSADTDRQLADAFVRFLDQRQEIELPRPAPIEPAHQPHYSLRIAGALWGAALMFLFLLLVLDNPRPEKFLLGCIVVLTLVMAVTRSFLYLARNGWRLPHVHVSIVEPNGNGGRH